MWIFMSIMFNLFFRFLKLKIGCSKWKVCWFVGLFLLWLPSAFVRFLTVLQKTLVWLLSIQIQWTARTLRLLLYNYCTRLIRLKILITTIAFKFHHIISMYYMCSWGTAFRRECAPGLLFNPVLKVCDFPETSGCISG